MEVLPALAASHFTSPFLCLQAVLELRGGLRGPGPLKQMAAPLIARFWRVQGTREKAPSKVTICAAQLPDVFRAPKKGLTQRRPAVHLTICARCRASGLYNDYSLQTMRPDCAMLMLSENTTQKHGIKTLIILLTGFIEQINHTMNNITLTNNSDYIKLFLPYLNAT